VRHTPYPDGSPPSCPDGAAPSLVTDGPAGPAQCSACSCGALQGAQCAVQVNFWLSTDCTGTSSSESYLLDTGYACYDWPNSFSGPLSGKFDGDVIQDQGSCSSAGGQLMNATPWQFQDAVCPVAVVDGACGGGDVCVAAGNADYTTACIRQAGSAACPAGWGMPIEIFSSFTDDRGCSGCSCSPSVQCSAMDVLYDNDGCAAGSSIALTNACQNLSQLIDFGTGSEVAAKPTAGGSCAPTGGAPIGALVPAGVTTYCCK